MASVFFPFKVAGSARPKGISGRLIKCIDLVSGNSILAASEHIVVLGLRIHGEFMFILPKGFSN